MDVKRLFVAVDISEDARAAAAGHIEALRAGFRNVRAGWTAPGKMHVTLKFLGDTEAGRIADLRSAVREAAKRSARFGLELSGCGVFPSKARPRVLWIGLKDESGGLLHLHREIEDTCSRVGFKKEGRSFKPHLTLARIREPLAAAALANAHLTSAFRPVRFEVTETKIYESQLLPSGSIYSVLESTHLS